MNKLGFAWSKPFWIGLAAFLFSTIACGLPSPNSGILTATPSLNVPTLALPTNTAAADPTQTFAPAPSATLAPALPTNTRPAPAVPTNTRTPRPLSEVTIFFVAIGDNGQSGPKIGCGDSLVAVKQPIEPTTGVIRAALNKLFSFKQQDIGQSGLYNAVWQSNLAVGSARVDSGVATVMLTGDVKLGGVCDIPRFQGQIEQTILAQPGVTKARVFLNGKPIEDALSQK